MILAQMLEIVALNDLASVLCARKFSFAPQGVDPKLLPFHFWSLGISRRTYGFALVRSFVRSSVRSRRDIWRSTHQIFLKLGTKLHLAGTKKMFKADF